MRHKYPEDELKCRIIVSISSDIGTALALRWLDGGFSVVGTYRTWSDSCVTLKARGAHLYYCDLSSLSSISEFCEVISLAHRWDVLVMGAGILEPIGMFAHTCFSDWAISFEVNCLAQLRLLHGLLAYRKLGTTLGPLVMFFAGGGTNNATTYFSSYTLAKICLIKACELLDAEITDTRFAIVGPGWVKTKIHQQTLSAGHQAGAALSRTQEILAQDLCEPMERVLTCCDWIVSRPRTIISGRNFSCVHDPWGSHDFEQLLRTDSNACKLRRYLKT